MRIRLLSLLLCLALLFGLLPAGVFSAAGTDLAAAGDYDYTDPNNPYLAKDFESLEAVFEEMRPRDITVYIKLAKDIFRTRKGAQLTTNGADVVLDLAGYTLGVTTDETSLIRATNGQVTIEDSRRYDSSKKQWIDGRLEFETKDMDSDSIHYFWYTYLMSGDIVIKGGRFKNNNHSPDRLDSVFSGRSLEMYGGTFEADYPIILDNNRWYFQSCVIHDGTLRVNRDVAIYAVTGSILTDRHPVIERCVIENASGNEKVAAFYLHLEKDFAENHTASEAFAIWNSIVSPETYAFIDGTKQPKGNHGIIYNGLGALIGPLFSESYVLTPLSTVSAMRFTINDPQAGNSISYYASTPSRSPYQVEDYTYDTSWKNGVSWSYYTYMSDTISQVLDCTKSHDFSPSVKYRVWIRVGLKNKYLAQFADIDDITATINGNDAKVYDNDDGTLTVACDFTISNVVSFVQVLVPAPVAGGDISYFANVPDGAHYSVNAVTSGDYKNGVQWRKNGSPLSPSNPGKFEFGNKYEARVVVSPANQYVFAQPDEMTAAVNNRVADNVLDGGLYGYILVYSFNLSNIIGSVDLTIPEPDAGHQIEWTASAPEGADYTVSDNTSGFMANGVMWSKGTATITPGRNVRFEALETYKVVIRIVATNDHRFSGEDMTVTVNGNSAQVSGYYSDTDYLISYTFTAMDLINSLDITIPTPMKGDQITYDFTLPPESGFKSAAYTFDSDDEHWRNGMNWSENGMRLQANRSYYFTAGREYDLYIAVNPTWEPQFKYADISDMTATVNGMPAEIERSTYCYIVGFSFTLSAPSEPPTYQQETVPPSEPPTYQQETEPKQGYILGDVDESGKVNVFDASYILKGTTGTKGYPDYKNMDSSLIAFKRADVDGTGSINIFDAALVLKYATGDKSVEKYGIGEYYIYN